MRKPASNKASTSLPDAIASFSPELPLAVAFSGGADSTALLLACAEKWPGQVMAIHVNHGLQAAAEDFVRHCEKLCADLGVPLSVLRVNARHVAGQSPEDAARNARYAALQVGVSHPGAPMVCRAVALAQHADDQVETMLLALSRGAGLPGLAAMPARWERDGLPYYRPLLAVRSRDIRAWLVQGGVEHIEDPTNTDETLTRNRIRARLLPALDEAFPQFCETFARSARHAAQAQQVLDEVARDDLARASRPPDPGLLLAAIQLVSRVRQANLVRHWLKATYGAVPSAAQLAELQGQITACTTLSHRIRIKIANGFVERRGDVLAWYNTLLDPGKHRRDPP
jgi:tRNA(Ile)-lysidine synthase